MALSEASGGPPEMSAVEHFEPLLGRTFRFKGASQTLRLVRVAREPAAPPGVGRLQPFTLIFSEPKTRDVLPEGIYEVEVEGAPGFALHIAPIHTPAPDAQEYQAAFN